ncbi:MAG: hypothetical protein KDD61_01050 [Bdellovibrionales bacterium]|nr:hypothetical protein [Bdellovibrionales bacterium]
MALTNAHASVNPCKIDPNWGGCRPEDNSNRAVYWETILSFPVDRNPESVLVSGNKIYVSTMGEETGPIKNGDGTLVRYHEYGGLDESFKVRYNLHSPMGMAIIGEYLFVVDIESIVCVSKANGDFQFQISLENEGVDFLNDIVTINSRHLIVSATRKNALYLVDVISKSYERIDIPISNPNGLSYNPVNRVLFVVGNKRHELGNFGNGILTAIEYKNGRFQTILFETSFGYFLDGVAVRGNTVLVSDWKSVKTGGSLFTYLPFTRTILKEQDLFIPGVADFGLGTFDRYLVTPDLINDKIYILKARTL